MGPPHPVVARRRGRQRLVRAAALAAGCFAAGFAVGGRQPQRGAAVQRWNAPAARLPDREDSSEEAPRVLKEEEGDGGKEPGRLQGGGGDRVRGSANLAEAASASSSRASGEGDPAPPPPPGRKYHVVVDDTDGPYLSWQVEVFWYWYRKHKEAHPDSDLGGFTRVLHAAADDHLSALVPTVRVDPLDHPGVATYPPLKRPHALRQFLRLPDIDSILTEDYVFLCDTDMSWMPDALVPNLANATTPAAFKHGKWYMDFEKHPEIVARWNKKDVPLADLYPVGQTPLLIHRSQLAAIVEIWPDLAVEMWEDKETRETYNWVLDMYAFAYAASQVAGGPVHFELHPELMVEPPWIQPDGSVTACADRTPPEPNGCAPRQAMMIHYTFGAFWVDGELKANLKPAATENEKWQKIRSCVTNPSDPCFGFEKRIWQHSYPPAAPKEPPPALRAAHPAFARFLDMFAEAAAANLSGRWNP